MSFPVMASNLTSFLRSVTPIVPSKPLPKGYLGDENSMWHSEGKDKIEYFTLGDVWKCFELWSAYGVGATVVLSDDRDVQQFYVPYLSAIQIYTNKSAATSRNLRGENDKSNKTRDGTLVDSGIHQEGKDRLGNIYFEYQEIYSPCWRAPFAEKMCEFTQSHPALLTLKSVDLSPASWMSVAWYPIYHIPSKGEVKELATCFLTYHTLSSSFQDSTWGNDCDASSGKGKGENRVSLPPFGLSTFRMQGDLWVNQESHDYEKMIDLKGAANSWLKQLNFQHHDFNFFNSHSPYQNDILLCHL